MNKKGKIMTNESPLLKVSPLLLIGILIFLIPYFGMIFNWGIPKWISGIGVVVILVGAGFTIADQ